jgi:ribokinase
MSAVLVAGSINMDIVASTDRFPKVGETVAGKAAHFFPGGKGANQAVAAAKSGAPTTLIGRLGLDSFGHDLKAFLAAQGVNLEHVAATAKAPTGMALITVCDSHNTIVVVPGANALVEPSDVGVPIVREGDVLVSQLEIPVPTVAAFFSRGRAARARTILNPAPVVGFDRALLDLADIIVLNETELGTLTGAQVGEDDAIARVAGLARDLRRSETQIVCVTLGRRGAVALVDHDSIVIPGRNVAAVDTTGAGDCFVGALAARLAHGMTIHAALEYANLAASICVQRMGAGPSMPTLAELESAMNA